MKRKINKVRVFSNDNDKCRIIETSLNKMLEEKGFSIDEFDYDLGIAIGGDGSFLRMIRESSFDKKCLFVGINAGTLGFAQEVNPSKIDLFLDKLKLGEYAIEEIDVMKTKVKSDGDVDKVYSLNEIYIRDGEFNTLKNKIYVDNNLLEEFSGDGVLVASTFGSTAYNLSFGGAIVHPKLKTLQVTSIAPLNNRSYRNLINSLVLPMDSNILIESSSTKKIMLSVDGVNYNYDDVDSISTTKKKKGIKVLRLEKYDFATKINEKFLK